ncbi:MAG: acyl-CoA thioester hydrolase/BAAT C-terminal domain-containing protein [Pseudoxanthomonas sp.]
MADEAICPPAKPWGVLFAIALLCCHGSPASAQSLRTEPAGSVLEGQPVRIVADGLRAHEEVGLRAERWYDGAAATARPPRLFRSEIRVRADADGRIDLDRMAPLSGSYQGVDPRGMFWSMVPLADAATQALPTDTALVRLVLQRQASAPLQGSVRLLPALPDVVATRVAELPGAVFARRPDDAPRPALIVLGGSEGGSSITEAAAPFASHGFAVLALPYFSPADGQGRRELPDLPEGMVELPIEFLQRAHDWLAERSDVDATRIALHGTSAGATFALLGAMHLDWVDAVVASVPSDVVFDGWGPGIAEGSRSAFSLHGEPLPFVPQIGYEREVARAGRGLDVHVRKAYERGRAARPDLAVKARIPVERIGGQVMVIGAYDDQMWPSGAMAQRMTERRIEAGLPVTALLFADAGHLLYDTGYAPTTTRNQGRRKVGGTPAADAHAQAETWQETFRFLRRALDMPPE